MVWEKPERKRMNKLDWNICGHDVGERPLPARRLEVPIPDCKEDLHHLAHFFAGISEELHTIARTPGPVRSAIHETMGLLRYKNQQFLELRKDWEREWKERESGSQPKQGTNRNPGSLTAVK